MTNVYDVIPTLKRFRDEYGARIDRISGVLILLREAVESLSAEDVSDIFKNKTYIFLDDRFHYLMEKRNRVISAEKKYLYERRYAFLSRRLELLLNKHVYQTPENKRMKKKIVVRERNRRRREKREQYHRPEFNFYELVSQNTSID